VLHFFNSIPPSSTRFIFSHQITKRNGVKKVVASARQGNSLLLEVESGSCVPAPWGTSLCLGPREAAGVVPAPGAVQGAARGCPGVLQAR